MAIVNGVPFASLNPTSGTIPINNSDSFADSKLSTWGANDNIRQVQDSTVDNTLGIFVDADGYGTVPASKNGIEWGIFNLDEGTFGTNTFLDCSIGLTPAPTNLFGSGIVIRTQASVLFSPEIVDTQVDMLSVKPFSFFTNEGGTAVLGGRSLTSTSAYFNVRGDDGYPPPSKNDYACARFDGTMTAIVVPKVDSSRQSMMTPESGMILYNSTTNKFQGYANGAWVDFH